MKGLLASDEEEGEPASEYEVLQQSDFSGHRVLLTEDNSIAAAIAMDIMGMTGLESITPRTGALPWRSCSMPSRATMTWCSWTSRCR